MNGAVKNSRLRKFLRDSVHTGVQILPINGLYAQNECRQQSHKLKFRKLNASLKTLRRREFGIIILCNKPAFINDVNIE